MIDPTPPMTACELHELFCRYIEDEQMAQARVAAADAEEMVSRTRLAILEAMWARLYGKREAR